MMSSYDRKELPLKLLIYSDIVQDDLENISHMNFRNGHTKELNGVRIHVVHLHSHLCCHGDLGLLTLSDGTSS